MAGRAVVVAVLTSLLCAGLATDAGAATPPQFSAPVFGHVFAASFMVADFNRDGAPDIAGHELFGRRVWIQFGNGDGNFRRPVVYPRIGLSGVDEALTAADVNGDGRRDLLLEQSHGIAYKVAVLLNEGPGRFRRAHVYPMGAGSTVLAADLNRDGMPDLITTAGKASDPARYDLVVRLGTGGGSFGRARRFRGRGSGDAVIADFNRDHNADVALVSLDTNRVVIRLGDGNGGFGPERIVGHDYATVVKVADVNRDRKPDLLTGGRVNSSRVWVRLGDGRGSFGPPSAYAMNDEPMDIVVADFDGDGKPDMATDTIGASGIAFRSGDGTGTFGGVQLLHPALDLGAVAADFNGDGRPDLAGDTQDSPSYVDGIQILLNTTGVRAPPCVVVPVLYEPADVAKRSLQGAGCRVRHVRRRQSSTVRKDRVISEHPTWGTVRPNHSPVDIFVSRGPH